MLNARHHYRADANMSHDTRRDESQKESTRVVFVLVVKEIVNVSPSQAGWFIKRCCRVRAHRHRKSIARFVANAFYNDQKLML